QDISRNVYNDPEKDFLIAYFAASEKESPPLPGTILNLPVLDATLLMQFVDIQSDLREAKTFFQERRYDEAVAAARKILVHDPTNSAARELTRDSYCKKASALFRKRKYEEAITVAETLLAFEPTDLKASDLINASYYKMGTLLTYKQKYSEALNMYNKVAPDYHDVQKTIADLQEIMVQEAEEHYRMGVKFFVNDKFAEAIEEWEKALALNPDHKKAKSDVESTRSLLERLENLK
ncbi:MAG: tetratricopeptide repeat protein, partial [Deltaproteobacteria bacterium]|nr:tetratricopeptide repeat protein [Deltaproteobacteria bacterium]